MLVVPNKYMDDLKGISEKKLSSMVANVEVSVMKSWSEQC
jgi:hypothetical protein